MKAFCFMILWLAYNELSVHPVFCMFQTKDEYALVVRKHSEGFDFAPASTSDNGQIYNYLSKYHNFYYLCPEKLQTRVLKIEKRLYAGYGPEKKICQYAVEPSIFRAKVSLVYYELETIHLHRHDIGFVIDYDKFNAILSRTYYESLDEKYYFLPMISVYTYVEWKLTYAVSYEIVTTDVKKKLKNTTLAYKSSGLFSDKVENFYRNQESKLKVILRNQYDSDKHALELGSLVNENDFAEDRWKKTTRYKAYQILIWKNNVEIWRDIQEFARYVGSFGNSKTTVTAGIGKPLTITGYLDRKYKMEWGEGENTMFIPELYWLIIKYYEDEETTGMVIIMHNEPTGGKDVKKICDKNPCIQTKVWFPSTGYDDIAGRVYCCKLKPEILNKLGAQIIHKDFCFFKHPVRFLIPDSWKEDKKETDVNDDK